jgi:replication factor C subunit 1
LTPIVCICNDRQAQKIKSLAGHCYDLRVKRPLKTTIATRLIEIGRLEGLTIEQSAAELMVEQCGNDIRQAIHAMQMWKASSNNLTYGGLKEGLSRIEKDKVLRQSPFDSCLSILQGMSSQSSFEHRYNSFFVDYSLVPLLVQQNYIENARAGVFKNPKSSDVQKLEAIARAAGTCVCLRVCVLRTCSFY